MALPNPLKRFAAARRAVLTVERHPDDLPKLGLFTEPVVVSRLDALSPDVLDDGRHQLTFLVEVRDADGKRCSDFSVEATVSGPERTRTVQGTTDLLGRIRFRMAGPPGRYRIELVDVAAGGLAWARDAGPLVVTTEVAEPGAAERP